MGGSRAVWYIVAMATMSVGCTLYGAEKEKELKQTVSDNTAELLHKTTYFALRGETMLFNLLLAANVDPNAVHKGKTPMQLVEDMEKHFCDCGVTMSEDMKKNIEVTKAWLKSYQRG